MNLKEYIQGKRSGKEANRLEREAMKDPFLQDALDGFDAVTGNHAQNIERLEQKFASKKRSGTTRRFFIYGAVAASILLIVGFSAVFFFGKNEDMPPLIALNEQFEYEKVLEDDFSELETLQMEETQLEIVAVAERATPKHTSPVITPEPDKSMEFILAAVEDVSHDKEIAVAGIVADEMFVTEYIAEASVAAEEIVAAKIAPKFDSQKESGRAKASSSVSKDAAAPHQFGKKEFQTFCNENADKNICSGLETTVKLSFYIDRTGKPTNIEFEEYTCEEAKREVEKLLTSSPVWTQKKRNVTMTVKLNN